MLYLLLQLNRVVLPGDYPGLGAAQQGNLRLRLDIARKEQPALAIVVFLAASLEIKSGCCNGNVGDSRHVLYDIFHCLAQLYA